MDSKFLEHPDFVATIPYHWLSETKTKCRNVSLNRDSSARMSCRHGQLEQVIFLVDEWTRKKEYQMVPAERVQGLEAKEKGRCLLVFVMETSSMKQSVKLNGYI